MWFPGLDTVVADSRDGDISAARLTPAAKVTKRRQLSRYRSQTRRLPVLGLLRASFRAAAMVWAEREARLGASPNVPCYLDCHCEMRSIEAIQLDCHSALCAPRNDKSLK